MYYIIQRGDTLAKIARRFNTTVEAILAANVICNQNFIFVGTVLLIPPLGVDFPKAGGRPYYVVQYGDSLWCLAQQFNTTVHTLAQLNHIINPNQIYARTELLIGPTIPDANELFEQWDRIGRNRCESMTSLEAYGVYYLGSYMWEGLGERALPYLANLLLHPCETVRFYTVLSLGKIASLNARQILQLALQDNDPFVSEFAQLALRRINIALNWGKRTHILIRDWKLLMEPNYESASIDVPYGTAIIALRWQIPSPTLEEGPVGGLQIYDQVQILETGQIGFLPRVGFNQTLLI